MEKLSVKDAMEKLNVSETTIRRMIKRGDLPNITRENRKIWIPQSDIDAYLQKQQSEPPSEAAPEPAVASAPEPESPDLPLEPPKPQEVAQPEPEAMPEPEEAPVAKPVPEPRSIIAQPIDELDDDRQSPPSFSAAPEEQPTEPATYSPGAVQPRAEHEQSFKWIVVQAGILSTKWLEKIFHSIRESLEKYKKKSFPKSSQKEE
jgi:excisionase family DNA binding protein